MKKNCLLFLNACVISSVMMLSSCKDYAGNEKSHPLFVKAGTAKDAGEFQNAAKCYEEFLMICPKSLATHFELGKLYGDNLNDPLKAVYHYEKWLEMSPNDPNNSDDMRTCAEKSRRDLFKKLAETYKDDPLLKQSGGEVEKMKAQLAAYQEYNAKLKAQNEQMRVILLKHKELIEKANAKRRNAPAAMLQQTGKKEAAAVKSNSPAADGSARSYQVQPGDSLYKISRKMYGSAKHVQLIIEANKDKLGASGKQLRPGQMLTIPAVQK